MSDKTDDGWYHGRSENSDRRFSAPVTDCSDWEPDIPADQWTRGRSVRSTTRFTAPVIDCSDWDRLPAVWLELREPVEPVADPAAVEEATVRLIRAADAAAPELGLTLDPDRSGVHGDNVVVALTPTRPVGPPERLAEIARALAPATVTWRRAG